MTEIKRNVMMIFIGLFAPALGAQTLHIAVASNFTHVMQQIVSRFESEKPVNVLISSGSSGKLYAQIRHGAPYDIFFSADTDKPKRLIREKSAVQDSFHVYAVGQLVLWSPTSNATMTDQQVLFTPEKKTIALANPKLAPYGAAAASVLKAFALTPSKTLVLVYGENINQTFQFVQTGNAELGFVALSQITQLPISQKGSYWQIPNHLYPAIEQGAVLLNKASTDSHARAFMHFVTSPTIRQFIQTSGYSVVEEK